MSPMFRERDRHTGAQAGLPGSSQPLRMVLDDETVERLRQAASDYGMEVEELMVALLQASADRVRDLLGEPPSRPTAN